MKQSKTMIIIVLVTLLLVLSLYLFWTVYEKRALPKKSSGGELEIAEYVISWQVDSGGWCKNNAYLYTRPYDGKEFIGGTGEMSVASIDNDATVTEIRFLTNQYDITKKEFLVKPIIKGIDFLLEMQYESGAFPQFYPLIKSEKYPYYDYGTFNDNATIKVLTLYKAILADTQNYAYLGAERIGKIRHGFNIGIEFVLNSQILVNGRLTVWCAQHDPFTYEPRSARTYELASLSGYESARILKFLIALESDDPRIENAIFFGKQWFRDSAEKGLVYDRYAKSGVYFYEADAQDVYLWYRFYEIDTNRGFFADRNGIKVYDIMAIDIERREGYSWAGDWGKAFMTTKE